ncbi:MAG: hypothetical protein LPH21_12550 [Shewanella sp.]|nr:hypothetical protein [Shewanella sp.]
MNLERCIHIAFGHTSGPIKELVDKCPHFVKEESECKAGEGEACEQMNTFRAFFAPSDPSKSD